MPKKIVISADVIIHKITNSTSGFQPDSDILGKGSISFTLTHGTLSKQFSILFNNHSAEYEDNTTSKILYTNSEVSTIIVGNFKKII